MVTEIDYTAEPKVTVKELTGEVTLVVRGTSLHDFEKTYILRILEANEGNKTKTANELGITIKTLYNKLHGYGLFEKYQTQKKKGEVVNAN